MTAKVKIDSNVVGLNYMEEASLGVLPGTPIIIPLEPNSFSDFGGQVTTKARNPINASRQRKKGNVVDLDASGGFNTDVTSQNLKDIMQGFMFADIRAKESVGEDDVIDSVANVDNSYNAGEDLDDFSADDLVLAEGFTNAANNGLKVVVSAIATKLIVVETLVDEAAAPTDAKITRVGLEGAATDMDIENTGTAFPTLTSGALDFETLGLIVGEWIRIGGDATVNKFVTAANNGFARIRTITTSVLTFDKTENTMVTEIGTDLEIHLFFGDVLKNERAADIVRRSYALERTLGEPDDTDGLVQSEVLHGAIANDLTLNMSTADLITADLTFIATEYETRSAATGVTPGTRQTLVEADAFNTTSNVVRTHLAIVSDTDADAAPLFAFAEEFTININNNASPNKAIGTLGAFEVTAGMFTVTGSLTVYFVDVEASDAVINNSDVTFDVHNVLQNKGITIDLPLIALGDARVNVEADQAIKLPITNDAFSGAKIDADLDYTLLFMFWNYLPDAAAE